MPRTLDVAKVLCRKRPYLIGGDIGEKQKSNLYDLKLTIIFSWAIFDISLTVFEIKWSRNVKNRHTLPIN